MELRQLQKTVIDESIYQHFEQLSDEDFQAKFHDLARLKAFSAIASGAGAQEDREKLKSSLTSAGIPAAWLDSKESLTEIVYCITKRIMAKKPT